MRPRSCNSIRDGRWARRFQTHVWSTKPRVSKCVDADREHAAFMKPTAPFTCEQEIVRVRSTPCCLGGVGVLVGIFILLRDDGFFLRWDRCYMYLDARHDSDETSSCTRSPAWRSNCRKKAAALWIRVQQRCDRDAQETSGQTLRADVLHTQMCTRKKENGI